MSERPRPFGLAKSAVEQLRDEFAELRDRFNDSEIDTRERMVRVETKVDAVREQVDTLFQFAVEDRQSRQVAVQEQGKTARAKVSARTRIVTVLLTTLGGVIGAGIAAAASGCI